MVEHYFKGRHGFWREVLAAHPQTVRKICPSGFDGKHCALNFKANVFHRNLRANAKKMLDKYGGDPRKIWAAIPERICLLYDRFRKFDGIGDALAKMAQFILVRGYGVAGGKKLRQVGGKAGHTRAQSSCTLRHIAE